MSDEMLIEDKIIDVIANARGIDRDEAFDEYWRPYTHVIIATIRSHVNLVAEVCPQCKGIGEYTIIHGQTPEAYEENNVECDRCKGHGVVPIEPKKEQFGFDTIDCKD